MNLVPGSSARRSPPEPALLSDGPGPGTDHRLRVLAVCTANQCRSPMTEFLLRRAVEDRGLGWQIASAGTHARPGLPLLPTTQKVLRSHGIVVNGWSSRRVNRRLLDGSDLVLTATREHRSSIVAAHPDLLGRTFPLLQFVRLAAAAHRDGRWTPAETDPAALLAAIRSVQGEVQVPLEATDLADPFGQRYRRFRRCGDIIKDAVEEMLDA